MFTCLIIVLHSEAKRLEEEKRVNEKTNDRVLIERCGSQCVQSTSTTVQLISPVKTGKWNHFMSIEKSKIA